MSEMNETHALMAINEATQVVFKALVKLPHEFRQRVIQSVGVQLGLAMGNNAGVVNARQPVDVDLEFNSSGDFSADRTLSPKSFLLEKRPQSDVERVACLAYYITHYRDMPYFKTVDISKLNTEAAQQKLTNPSNSVHNAAKMGYLVSASKGQKQLSAAGELFVEALPAREKAKEAMAQARPRRGARRKASAESKA